MNASDLTVETAQQTLMADNRDDRNAYRAAAEFLIDHQDELSDRAVVLLVEGELHDPAWSKVVESTHPACACSKPVCKGRNVRIIGAPVRTDIAADEGSRFVVTPGNEVYFALRGTTEPVYSFYVSPPEADPRIVVMDRLDGDPIIAPFDGFNEAMSRGDSRIRCLKTRNTPYTLPEPVARVEGVSNEGLILFLDHGVEQVTVRQQFNPGSQVTVGTEKIYIRRKGAEDTAAERCYFVDAEQGMLVFEDDPLGENALIIRLTKGSLTAYRLYDLTDRILPLPDADRVMRAKVRVPLPMVRIDAVDETAQTVTLTLDEEFEVYTPETTPPEIPEFLAQALAGGGLDPAALAALGLITGNADSPEEQ